MFRRKTPEVLRRRSSARLALTEKDRTPHPEREKNGHEEPRMTRKRKRGAETEKDTQTEALSAEIGVRDKASQTRLGV